MANKRPKPEEIVTKLRQVEVLMGKDYPALMRSDKLVLLSKPIIAGADSMDRGHQRDRPMEIDARGRMGNLEMGRLV